MLITCCLKPALVSWNFFISLYFATKFSDMPGLITCPNCNTKFQPTDAFREEVQRELNNKAREWQAKKKKNISNAK